MQSAITQDTNALGFLPSLAVTGSVKPLDITDFNTESLQLPLLAYTATQPAGAMLQWLACLQNTFNS
jgi:hypothetical protein